METREQNHSSSEDAARVLITGAGSGIGRAVASRLAATGAGLLGLLGRTRKTLEQTAELCQGQSEDLRCVVLEADVGDAAAVEGAFEELGHITGWLDGLVNNAGCTLFSPIEKTTLAQWEGVLRTNLTGPFLVTRACLPLLRRARQAAIVNVASTVGQVGLRHAAAYCASKAGLLNLTRVLALDHAREGIRVNAVAPGPVDTSMVFSDRGDGSGAEELRGELSAMHPLGRIAEPEDVAAAVAYLLSEDASFVTGSVITVDGGLLAGFNR